MLDVQASAAFLCALPSTGVCALAEQADEAGRLEAALERIAHAAAHAAVHHPHDQAASVAIDTSTLAARLDALIAELRTILGQS